MESNSLYKFQDLAKTVVPGLYFVGGLFLFLVFAPVPSPLLTRKDIIEFVKGCSSVIVYMIPVIGFIAGYAIYSIMSFVERTAYRSGVSHPAKIILNIEDKKYEVANLQEKLGIKKVDNSQAKKIVREAREYVGTERVEKEFNDSLMARSIFGAQLFLSFILPFTKFSYGLGTYVFMFVGVIVFFLSWRHRNLLYYKAIFSRLIKDCDLDTIKDDIENIIGKQKSVADVKTSD